MEPDISSKQTKIRRLYTRSSSFKIALFLAVPLGITVLVLVYFLNQFNEDSLIREVESGIDSIMSAFDGWNSPEYNEDDRLRILEAIQKEPSGSFYVYYDQSDTILYQDIDIQAITLSTMVEGLVRFDVPPGAILRGPSLPTNRPAAGKIRTFNDGSRLLVAQDIDEALQIRELMRFLGLITISLMSILIIISFCISSYVVTRMESIAKTSREIVKTGDLSRRIEVGVGWDDLSNLAGTLNHMLERIEHLLDGVRRVSDNIAHDLRTPLSRLRNNLENLQNDSLKKGNDNVVDRSEQLILEADQLLQTFSALLRIGNIESGKIQSDFVQTSMQELLEDVIDLYAPLAEEKNISLQLALNPAQIKCDRDLLFQAVSNLLDNAIKFSFEGGYIKIGLQELQDQQVELIIEDSGPGISDSDKEKVFDRFYRAESSRSSPGNGLGLSLVTAIIDLHHGQVFLEDGPEGLVVKLLLPSLS